jgi:hypothetical protein
MTYRNGTVVVMHYNCLVKTSGLPGPVVNAVDVVVVALHLGSES